jgi:hypothetical protein
LPVSQQLAPLADQVLMCCLRSCCFLLQRRLSDAADAPASSTEVKCDQQLSAKAKPADRSPQADGGDLPEPALDLLAGTSPDEGDAAAAEEEVAAGAEVRLSLIAA